MYVSFHGGKKNQDDVENKLKKKVKKNLKKKKQRKQNQKDKKTEMTWKEGDVFDAGTDEVK